MRFYLHGDVVPDEKIDLTLPMLDERGEALFKTRGIQPFHDFPEGPDWWNTDDYKAIIGQLPKLRMNFIGLHTYPEGGVGPEPTVWIGLKDDVNPDGTVRFSSQSSYENTLRAAWGNAAKKTSDFSFGTAQLFERDDYGPEVMHGATPWPDTPEERNEVFNKTGKMLARGVRIRALARRADVRRHGNAVDHPQSGQRTDQEQGQRPERSGRGSRALRRDVPSDRQGLPGRLLLVLDAGGLDMEQRQG